MAVTQRMFKPAAVLPVRRRQQLELGEGAARGAQLSFGRRDERVRDAAPLVRLAYRESAYRNCLLKLSGGCMLTKLKVLEFFSGLEFFRTCARSQGSAVRKKLFLASMRRSHGQWPRARWKVAKRCNGSEGGRDRCSVASADGSAEAAADCVYLGTRSRVSDRRRGGSCVENLRFVFVCA